MIAIDTNILLRYLVRDDEEQYAIARQFLEDGLSDQGSGYVSLVAVLEIDWVLRASYRVASDVVIEAIAQLMDTPNLVFQNAELVAAALAYEHGDLADNILHRLGAAAGCTSTITFDKKFARLGGVELLTASTLTP